MLIWIWAFFMVFLAGLVQGCTGFGLGMVAVPALMLFLPQTLAVPLMTLLSIINTMIATWRARKHVHMRRVLYLSVGAVIGIPFGIFLLRSVPPAPFKFSVGLLVLIFTVLLLSGWQRSLQERKRLLAGIGVLSGIMGGAIGMSGPIVVLFLANQKTERDEFRASLLGYFLLSTSVFICYNMVAFWFLGAQNIFGLETFKYWILLLPALLLGTFTGIRLSSLLPEATFRRISLGIVTLISVLLLLSAFTAS